MTTPRGMGWNMVYMETPVVSREPVVSMMQSKIPKVLPHTFDELKEYDFLLWVDDKVKLNLNNIEVLMQQMLEMDSPMAMSRHMSTDIQLKNGEYNVLFDLCTSMYQWRYRTDWDKMIQYITEEIDEGYTLRSKLYLRSTIILRNMRHQDTIKINNLWYDHILRCGPMCQISFHFVKQRFNNICVLPDDIQEY
jgi:hypothetical protein